MLELSLALKYLIPKKARLSVSLIGVLSALVVSLVVCLILVFLSVTNGIEKGWIERLTTLHAPLRITPTPHYYSSYYYQIDSFSSDSLYTLKTLHSKRISSQPNPYNALEDGALPTHFPLPELDAQGNLKDPVKGLSTTLETLKESEQLHFQDFELSGALLRLQLTNAQTGGGGYLTQASYLATIPHESPKFSELLLPTSARDLTHLLKTATHSTQLSREDSSAFAQPIEKPIHKKRIQELLQSIQITKLKTAHPLWQMPFHLLPDNTWFSATIQEQKGKIHHIKLASERSKQSALICKKHNTLVLKNGDKEERISSEIPLLTQESLTFSVQSPLNPESLCFYVKATLQGAPLQGDLPWDHSLEVVSFSSPEELPSPQTTEEGEIGVLLSKNFLDQGARLGDRGYLSYSSASSSSVQEQRLPIFVRGFYDPGPLFVGNKSILVPPGVTETINASNSSFYLDKTQSNGFLVWPSSYEETSKIAQRIQRSLEDQGLDQYWKVTPFYEYDFARDLMEQFQSDKILFMLIAILILFVGCCNIISMGILLVSSKKKEIGILQAMGTSKRRILMLFSLCGGLVGLISTLIGTLAALLVLGHIDAIAALLSSIQGHTAFNPTFFGPSLPHTLSSSAFLFILIVTPLLSLCAGLIPAIKACRMDPANLLRSE